MKVRFKTLICSADYGNFQAGEERDVPEAFAKVLIEAKAAEALDAPPPVEPPLEDTDARPQETTEHAANKRTARGRHPSEG